MARSARLSQPRREEIVGLIGRRLAHPTPFLVEEAPVTLAESFPLFVLDVSGEGIDSSVGESASDTSAWHHQLKQGETATLIARTLEGKRGEARDLWLARSELAAKIGTAIEWADAHVSDDWTARLLFIPPLLAHALWFERGGEERIYVIECPPGVLVEGNEMNARDLLELAIEAARSWGPFDLTAIE